MERKALIASIVLNFFLLASVLGLAYGWPLFIHVKQLLPKRERHVSFFATFPLEQRDVVFVGDGLIEEGPWSEIFPDVPVKNRGIAGDTTRDVALRIGQIAAGNPAKVFLMVGGKDAEAEHSVEQTSDEYASILQRLKEDSPNTKIYVQSILPRSIEESEALQQRNEGIARVARSAGAEFIDLFPAFVAEDGGIRPDLSNDKAHLLADGYMLWRDQVASRVQGQD